MVVIGMKKPQCDQQSASQWEELRHALLDEVTDYAIFMISPDNRVVAWSAGAERIIGYREEEIIGRPGSIIFTPEDIKKGEVEKELGQSAAMGRAEDRRWHMRKDKTRFWANGVLSVSRDDAGNLRGFVKVLRDETERKRLEEERDRFFTLSMDMLCIAGLDGYFKRVNPAFERTLGYVSGELLVRPIIEFINPEEQQVTSVEFRKLADGIPSRYLENRFRCKDGQYRWTAWSYFPVAEENIAYGVGRDITQQKEAAAEREQSLQREQEARAEAETANRLKDEFLATLSHELRNPLNLIVGHSEVLLRSPQTQHIPAIRVAAEAIHRSALVQSQLINDLLDLSRLQTGKLALNQQTTFLAPVITEAVEAVRVDASAKQITVSIELPDGPLAVMADPLRLQQIVWNLLNNAVKFTPNGGQVWLSVEQEGERAKIVVTDNGQGIDPGFLPHIFEMFRQADARTTRRHGGMGIGLALVHQLVELHGGQVEAASAGVSRGARFTVWLPLHSDKTEARPSAVDPVTTGELTGLLILVVDDSPETVDLMRFMLQLEGATVSTATSAAEALHVAETQDFDLIFSDISMPEMDGYELIEELRKRPRTASVPVVALTGFGRVEDAEQAAAAGFKKHLTKPILLDDLLRVTREVRADSANGR
jgi:PAS domain S-box-containing protein